jgi:thioredoxin-like negative regulator of GroEL
MRFQLPAAALLATSLVLAPTLARADDTAGAQALFNDGKKLMTSGKYADACPKLEESQRLAPAIGTKFNLADCYEHTGRLASAWAAFLSVAAAARKRRATGRRRSSRSCRGWRSRCRTRRRWSGWRCAGTVT